ncbi:hypothetical protein [Salinirubrum litoreum]|uniref:Uncharacterized protein n=1 Tax=Salinirubrum litoreum TaxID=1126234 RepID=A0ABD5R8B2_9EURY|nr:hypothetical protein [Salinirubrum litoreum]
MFDSLGLSRRDVGAGLAIAGSAYVAASLFALFNLFSGSGRGNPGATLGIIVTPVLALTVATVVWRVVMPEEPNPRYGAMAGAISGAVAVFLFTALVGITAIVLEAPTIGPPTSGTVFEAIEFLALIVGLGLLITLPFIVPIAATVGYGYERYVARGQA